MDSKYLFLLLSLLPTRPKINPLKLNLLQMHPKRLNPL
jgi:hypothetical protein